MKQDRVKVVLAAEHAIVRAGLRRVLGVASDIQIVGEASKAQEAILLVEQIVPDVLIVELEMPIMDGIQIMKQLKQGGSKVSIIIFSLEKDSGIAPEMKKRGAWGFFSRQETPDKIVEAVRQAGRGDR